LARVGVAASSGKHLLRPSKVLAVGSLGNPKVLLPALARRRRLQCSASPPALVASSSVSRPREVVRPLEEVAYSARLRKLQACLAKLHRLPQLSVRVLVVASSGRRP